MSENVEYIDHQATVSAIDRATNTLTVKVVEEADCGECPAGKLCQNFSPDKNLMKIKVADAGDFSVGETVTVRGRESLHRKAIMLVTVIPSLALIAAMIGVYLLTWSQLAACLSGLGAMTVFFVLLYLVRGKLAHEFNFEVIKTENQ